MTHIMMKHSKLMARTRSGLSNTGPYLWVLICQSQDFDNRDAESVYLTTMMFIAIKHATPAGIMHQYTHRQQQRSKSLFPCMRLRTTLHCISECLYYMRKKEIISYAGAHNHTWAHQLQARRHGLLRELI